MEAIQSHPIASSTTHASTITHGAADEEELEEHERDAARAARQQLAAEREAEVGARQPDADAGFARRHGTPATERTARTGRALPEVSTGRREGVRAMSGGSGQGLSRRGRAHRAARPPVRHGAPPRVDPGDRPAGQERQGEGLEGLEAAEGRWVGPPLDSFGGGARECVHDNVCNNVQKYSEHADENTEAIEKCSIFQRFFNTFL